jgi:hypothetical protein
VEVIPRKINAAPILGNKGMSMAQFSARLVELEARPASKPDGRYPRMVEGGREFVESGGASSTLGKEGIHRYIKNAGSLAQTNLRNGRVDCSGIGLLFAVEPPKEKAGRNLCPLLMSPGSVSQVLSYVNYQTSSQRTSLAD